MELNISVRTTNNFRYVSKPKRRSSISLWLLLIKNDRYVFLGREGNPSSPKYNFNSSYNFSNEEYLQKYYIF